MNNELVREAYERHGADVNRLAIGLTRDEANGEDLAQEAFVRLAREIAARRAPDNVRAWLFQVTRNLHISNCRRMRVAQSHADALARSVEIIGRSAEDEFIERERALQLRRLIDGMEPLDRSSLVMSALGYSGAEIGHTIGRTENAVRVRLFRARARLRSQLVAAGAESICGVIAGASEYDVGRRA